MDTVPANAPPILRVEYLVTRFDLRSGILNCVNRQVYAVENISFDLYPGETLGLVGESGCGKSTTWRALLKLVDSQRGNPHLRWLSDQSAAWFGIAAPKA